MKQIGWHSKLLVIVAFLNLIFLVSCTDVENSNTNSAQNTAVQNSDPVQENPSSDDVEKLLEIVLLPEIPEEVVWKEENLGSKDNTVPGPTDRKIIAVLQYTPENVKKIIALVEKNKQPQEVEVEVENWYPEELTAKSQLSGSESLRGMAFGANQFFNTPYGNGKITHIEDTNFFVLELFTT